MRGTSANVQVRNGDRILGTTTWSAHAFASPYSAGGLGFYVLVDQAAEPTGAQDAHADVAHGWLRSAVGRILQ